jgi:hypothetical protein
LVEPHLLDCYRLADGERADHPGVSGIVRERRARHLAAFGQSRQALVL